MSSARLAFMFGLLLTVDLPSCRDSCPAQYVDAHGNCVAPGTIYGGSGSPCPYGYTRDNKDGLCHVVSK